MGRGVRPAIVQKAGFTIVEVLIFLGVSSLIFTSAVVYMSGRQARQQFQSSVREFEAALADIANDVSTGYYQNGAALKCSATGTPKTPTFTAVSQGLGTNSDCIFVGTVVKLGDGTASNGTEKYTQFTMAGVRQTSSGVGVTSLTEANPRVIDVTNSYATKPIGGGVTVQCVRVGADTNPCQTTNNAALGFFTTFDGAALTSQSGSTIRTNALVYNDVAISTANTGLGGAISKINAATYASATLNPGVTLCLRSSGSNQYALIKIGGSGSSNTTITSTIKDGSSCA